MEKIKQALDRARKERGETDFEISKNASLIGGVLPEYAKTKSIEVSTSSMRESRISTVTDRSEYKDAFTILGIQVIQRMEEHRWTTISITSPRGSEGKTITAIHLAISIAKEVEYSVLLVDVHLRLQE